MTRTTTTDLAVWLGKLRLRQYAQTFIENNIEYDVLPDLTENDLKNLGVSLGHRKTLLKAIETLTAAQRASGTTTAASHPGTEALPPSEHREAERRQITVLFCDLVGSTQLAEKLDPEDLRIVIDAYRNVCTTAITRYQGHVARYFGDGVMAFFGWPRAHEDDASRAVHAALEILLSAITTIPGQVTLAAQQVLAQSSSAKLQAVVLQCRSIGWMRWARRRISRRVCRHLPRPILWSSRRRRNVSYRQPSIFKTLVRRNSRA